MLEYLPLPLRRAVYEVTWWLGDLLGPRAWRRRWQAVAHLPRVILWWLAHTGALVGEVCGRENRLLLWRILGVLPVLLVGFSLVFFLALANSATRRANNWYAQEAQMALARKEYAKARLAYQGLMQYEPEKPEYRLGLAMALAGLNDNATAQVLVARLAPEDAPGYAPAQNVVAEQLLRASPQTPQMAQQAEKHLLNALKADAKDPQTHALLAVLYSRRNRWDLVEEHLPLAGPAADEMALVAARMFASRGRKAEAESWAARAAIYYAPLTKTDPTNDEVWLNYAQATLYLRDFGRALDILGQAWKQTRHARFPTTYAHVVAIWLHDVEAMPSRRRLALLENALTWDSQNVDLQKMVLDPAFASAAGEVQPTTAPMSGAGIQALIQAILAARRDRASEMDSRLEVALSLGGPQMPAIASNVICTMASGKEPDATVALNMANALIRLKPAEPVVHRAHGMVLVQCRQWQASLVELELTISKFPDDKGLHDALAIAYGNLGRTDLAAEHRRLAAPPATAPATAPATRRSSVIESGRSQMQIADSLHVFLDSELSVL